MPDLITTLREAPQSFNLFQAISLLERSEPARTAVGRGLGLDEAVRLAAQVDMGFASSDIASVAASGRAGPPLTLRTAALTLAGAQGPVAAPFTELLLARRRQRDGAGLDFLDIYNQRLLGFWYRARAKHHLALQPVAGTAKKLAPLERSLDALSGLGRAEHAHAPGGDVAWLRHAGLQGAAPRSMTSLLTLLRDRLGIAFKGQQFVGCWQPLAMCDRACLQGPALPMQPAAPRPGLGQGATLGARAWDQSAGMALTAPPLPAELFAALLPGGARYPLLAWLVARHLQRDLTVTVELELATTPVCRLGGRTAPQLSATSAAAAMAPRLGRNAWLCSASAPASEPRQPYQHARFVLASPTNRAIERS
jgi:type VI secretion system protein ImpH